MDQDENHQFSNPANEVPPTPSVEQPNTSSVEQPTPLAKDSRRNTILITIGTVLLLIIIGALGYVLTKDYPPGEKKSITTTEENKNTHETMSAAEHLVSVLESKVTGEKQQVDSRTEQGGTGKADGIVYSNAAYKAGNQRFATYPAKGYGFGTRSTPEAAISDIAAVESYLKTHGFAETPEGSGVFASKDAVCAVMLFNKDIGGFDGMGVGCGDMNAYAENYLAALPFYYSYEASEPKPATINNLTFASPVVNNGADGYKNAHVSIGAAMTGATDGFSGLFYKAPNTSKWTYFMGTQNDIGCDKFDSAEIRKAFNGQRCVILPTGQESTVTSE